MLYTSSSGQTNLGTIVIGTNKSIFEKLWLFLQLIKGQKERIRARVWILGIGGNGANGAPPRSSDCHHCPPISQVSPPTQKPKKEIWRKKSEQVSVRRTGEKAAMSKCCQNWIIFRRPSSQYWELIGASNPDHSYHERGRTPGNAHPRHFTFSCVK